MTSNTKLLTTKKKDPGANDNEKLWHGGVAGMLSGGVEDFEAGGVEGLWTYSIKQLTRDNRQLPSFNNKRLAFPTSPGFLVTVG